MSLHQSAELADNARDKSKAVVLSQDGEEVADGLVAANRLGDLRDERRLGAGVERGRGHEGRKLGVLGDERLEGVEGLVGAVKGGRLGGRSVLWIDES